MRRKLCRPTVFDFLLVAVLLALPGWALVGDLRAGHSDATAYIYHDNRLLGAYPLSRDQTVFIGDRARPDVVIEIKSGRVRVAESNCPNQVCVHTGWVSRPGRTIVCVPNRVVIEVKGRTSNVDAESY